MPFVKLSRLRSSLNSTKNKSKSKDCKCLLNKGNLKIPRLTMRSKRTTSCLKYKDMRMRWGKSLSSFGIIKILVLQFRCTKRYSFKTKYLKTG